MNGEETGTYVIYKTETCTKCPLAQRSADNAGAKTKAVYLDRPEHAEELAALRAELGRDQLSAPMVRTPDGRILENLATISAEFRGMS
jgi:glutaredoxin